MDVATQILVIIVSIVLTIFLIIAITLGIYLIKLTSEIRQITKSAQSAVSNIDRTIIGISHLTSPVFMAQLVSKYLKKFNKKGSK